MHEVAQHIHEIPAHFIHENKTIAYDVTDLMCCCAGYLMGLPRKFPEKKMHSILLVLHSKSGKNHISYNDVTSLPRTLKGQIGAGRSVLQS